MRNLIISISIAATFAIVHGAQAQDKKSVVIGNLISRPNAILILNPLDGDQGFLLPQLRTSQRISINPVSPDDDGLMVFDVDEKSFYYWKENAWVKGLGNEEVNQLLNYDVATRLLSLSNGGQVDLSSLKEIPDPTGHAGK
ncbi:MAG TPA: hypothetical protein VD816_18575, partial [Ohtaekwangia sp.]|nr:hypothetical protein [Ohtaekwangia sp.]